jgi:hypothetical protein
VFDPHSRHQILQFVQISGGLERSDRRHVQPGLHRALRQRRLCLDWRERRHRPQHRQRRHRDLSRLGGLVTNGISGSALGFVDGSGSGVDIDSGYGSAEPKATIVNYGTVVGGASPIFPGNGIAIETGSAGTVVNAGIVSALGNSATGIAVINNSSVVNSGTIYRRCDRRQTRPAAASPPSIIPAASRRAQPAPTQSASRLDPTAQPGPAAARRLR